MSGGGIGEVETATKLRDRLRAITDDHAGPTPRMQPDVVEMRKRFDYYLEDIVKKCAEAARLRKDEYVHDITHDYDLLKDELIEQLCHEGLSVHVDTKEAEKWYGKQYLTKLTIKW